MGQTKEQIVKKSLASEMSLNADAKVGKIEPVSDGRKEYICQTCGKSYKRRKQRNLRKISYLSRMH